MRKRVLAGNLPEWRETLRSSVDPGRFEIVAEAFSERSLSGDGYDLAIPFTRRECELVRHVPPAAHRTLVPSGHHFHLANDKLAFAQWLVDQEFGQHVPAFALEPVIGCPFIRKGRVGANGQKCSLYIDEFDDSHAVDGHFYQECVPGQTEYATHTISVAGILLFMGTTLSFHDADLFVKGCGETPRHICRSGNVGGKEIKRILSTLGYTGYACFDYKLKDGIPMFFEMNPRIGYSSHLFADAFLRSALRALAYAASFGHGKPTPTMSTSTDL